MATSENRESRWGSGSYTTSVYAVEARSSHGEIVLSVPADGLGRPLVLTPHDWKRIDIAYGPVGVPNRLEFYPDALSHRFMTYECAMAIACWLQASREYGGIETRLVEIEFTSSFSTKENGTSEPLNLRAAGLELYHRLRETREAARTAAAVDPSAGNTGKPSTRV